MKTQTTTTKKTLKSKVKFSCASRKDFSKVTVNLSDIDGFAVDGMDKPAKGIRFVIDLINDRSHAPIGVVFTVNRDGSTAATNGWPHRLDLPRVGKPTFEFVDKIFPLATEVVVIKTGPYSYAT